MVRAAVTRPGVGYGWVDHVRKASQPMSIDAIAILPPVGELHGSAESGGWMNGEGPGGAAGLWRELDDGVLLHLGFPLASPDGDLYDLARRWMGDPPPQIWVFPDTHDPGATTSGDVQAQTAGAGRWIRAAPRRRTLLAGLGFSAEEEDRYQSDMGSGDPQRVAAAAARLQEQIEGADPATVEALLAEIEGR
jgi:hypothetical protein